YLADYIMSLGLPMDQMVVVAPDEGAVKRILPFVARVAGRLSGEPVAYTLMTQSDSQSKGNGPGFAIIDKRRSGGSTRQAHFIGSSVEGKLAVLIDDMITTGGSIIGAANAAHERGARQIYAACTHALLCDKAVERLAASPIDHLILCDTVPVAKEKRLPNMQMLSLASLLGEAIKRIHRNDSVSEMFKLQMEPQLIW
ncbi:MAG TPA: ribose-phosphate pyrophosphokinase, partial [Planctomycetaceae bacterium]|nr:ribose-phosphate pyrophosphokinase [Planctomycetaceae bacterium]